MNKVIYAVMFCASAAVFAQPNDGESYYVKSFDNQYVYTDGDGFGLGDEKQKTTFTVVKNKDIYHLRLTTTEGAFHYVAALGRREDEAAGRVRHMPNAHASEEFTFQDIAEGKYAIQSVQWNTLLRANGKQLDQTNGAEQPCPETSFELVNAAAAAVVTQVEDAPVAVQTPAVEQKQVPGGYGVRLNGDYKGVTLSKEGAKDIVLLKHKTVVAYVMDDLGNLWFATDSQGIEVFSTSVLKDFGDRGMLAKFDDRNWATGTRWTANIAVNAMHKDEKGQIWIALEAGTWVGIGGLVRFTPSDDGVYAHGKWRLFTKENSLLPSNHVREFGMLNDGSANVKMMKDGKVEVQMPLDELDSK